MKVLSLKLQEDIFQEAEKVIRAIHLSRNAYINKALHFYNQLNRRKLLRKKLSRRWIAFFLRPTSDAKQISDQYNCSQNNSPNGISHS